MAGVKNWPMKWFIRYLPVMAPIDGLFRVAMLGCDRVL